MRKSFGLWIVIISGFFVFNICFMATGSVFAQGQKQFVVVECSGTPYEIGLQYGKACKENVVKSINMHMGALKALYNASPEEVIANSKKFLPRSQEVAPKLIEQLKGTAEGAGVTFEEVFALRCMLELLEYYGVINGLCTSFAATGCATEGGKTLIGQNIDWSPDFPIDLLHIKPDSGPESLTIAFGGVLDWNLTSAGLGIAMNLVLCPPEMQRITVPTGVVSWKAMQQKNLGDAVGVFAADGRGLLNYVLASAEGDILQIETIPDDYNVLYPENGILTHSNHYLTERFKKGDNVVICCPDSYVRAERLKRLMKEHYGKLTPEIMMKLMADHGNYPSGICRHVDKDKPPVLHFESLVSFIMVPEEDTAYIAYGQPCKTNYVKYTF